MIHHHANEETGKVHDGSQYTVNRNRWPSALTQINLTWRDDVHIAQSWNVSTRTSPALPSTDRSANFHTGPQQMEGRIGGLDYRQFTQELSCILRVNGMDVALAARWNLERQLRSRRMSCRSFALV